MTSFGGSAGVGVGVNVVGHLQSASRSGHLARIAVAWFEAAGLRTSVFSWDDGPVGRGIVAPPAPAELFDVTVVCTRPDELGRLDELVGDGLLRGRHRIGWWCWDHDVLPPAAVAGAAHLDEIWVTSQQAKRAVDGEIEAGALDPIPVRVVIPPVPAPLPSPLRPPGSFTFVACCADADPGAFERELAGGVLRAYTETFAESGGTRLVLQCTNASGTALDRLRALAGRSDVDLIEHDLDAADRHALLTVTDVFVALHRADGLASTAAEAMAMGLPVVVTATGGVLGHATDHNSVLVPFRPVPVPARHGLPHGATWADPDLLAAGAAMRALFEDDGLRGRIGAQAAADLAGQRPAARAGELRRLVTGARSRALVGRTEPVVGRTRRARHLIELAVAALSHPLAGSQPYERGLDPSGAVAAQAGELADLQADVAALRALVDELREQVDAPPYLAARGVLEHRREDGSTYFGFDASGVEEAVDAYRHFEDIFRGTEAFVAERLEVYLPMLKAGPVADLGSGRGEMLGLLAAQGIDAIGVDLDEGMAGHARALGHEVVHADAVAWVEEQVPSSLGAIFSAQFIEHIPTESLQRLLAAAVVALEPGGLFIAETVNPHSLAALRTFWVDLTHQRPIFPETLLVFCSDAGFTSGEILFPNGNGDFDHDRRLTGEYAVIART